MFFCGAGVSVRSGLPDFKGLVKKLFSEFDQPFNGGQNDYGQMLQELENSHLGVREKIRNILTPDTAVSSDQLENHRNILRLASIQDNDGGKDQVRLVTTNFDNRFQQAANSLGLSITSDDAPKFSMPEDKEEWASLVHLHGRIARNDQTLKSLVLTSSDFGNAYLINGWARDFVVRLLREWNVVFVGYGLSDPLMRYLMGAAAASRKRSPNSFRDSYAFVPCIVGSEDKTRAAWKKKGITTPIVYKQGMGSGAHSLLWKTLGELADFKADPLRFREEIAQGETDLMPEGDTADRVIWALQNPATAKTFAEMKFFSDTADEEKFISWLNAFKKNKLFKANNVASVDALDYPPRFASPLDSVARHLTDWAARHTHQPALLHWLAEQDGSPHPHFAHELHRFVIKPRIPISEALRELWWIFLQSHPVNSDGMNLLETHTYHARKLPPNARDELHQRIMSALRPLPVVVPDGQNFGVRVRIGCGLLRCHYGRSEHILEDLEKKSGGFSMRHAESLSSYLERALSIMAWREMPASDWDCLLPEADDKRPSHQEYTRNYWKFLARMVRNTVRELIAEKQHRRLANLIAQWSKSGHPLMWRMVLYAAAEAAKCFPKFREGGNWGAKILIKECEALWGYQCRPECLRFLRRAGGTIASSELSKLERTILKGPPKEFHVGSFDGSPEQSAAHRMARLAKRAKISPESVDFLDSMQSKFPDVDFGKNCEYYRTFGEMGGWTVVPRENKLARIRPDMSPEECADIIQKNRVEDSHWPAFDFVENDLERAIATYEVLAARNVWDEVNWRDFLAALANQGKIDNAKSEQLLRMLGNAPDDFLSDCSFSIALALESVAKFRQFSEMENIWRKVWQACAGNKIETWREDGTVHDAFLDPCGMLAEIVVVRLSRENNFGHFAGLLEEILDSGDSGHMHGRAVVAGCAGFLFNIDREWTERRVMPMFAAGHPNSSHSWVEFLKRRHMSADFAHAIKSEFIDAAKQADKFSDSIRPAFAGLAFYICNHFPKVFSNEEQRRLVVNMKKKTRGELCKYLRFVVLSDDDGAKRGNIWRKSVGPFLQRAWPAHTSLKTPAMSELLGEIIIRTGDAFPDAVKWADKFLSKIAYPFNSSSGLIIHALGKGNEKATEEIPEKFPEECLHFLHRIVNLEDGQDYQFLELGNILERIEAADPKLCKRKKFRELKEALAK